jgi:hypothetical protein
LSEVWLLNFLRWSSCSSRKRNWISTALLQGILQWLLLYNPCGSSCTFWGSVWGMAVCRTFSAMCFFGAIGNS